MATVTKENAGIEAQREWSDLPIDVVGCIVGKLYWADRIRFAAVCKAWNVPPRSILPIMEERPWMLSFINDGPRIIKLLDPYRKKDYVVQELHGDDVKKITGFFWASRYGMIMCNELRKIENGHFMYSTLLFSPFTREIIEFPELEMELELEKGAPWCVPITSFFINPASPECVVYAFWRIVDWACMATCSPGDTAWKEFKFPLTGFMNFQPYGVTYLAGSFYCVTEKLDVGVFNLATQEWQVLAVSGPKPRSFSNNTYDGTVVHSDFDLLWYEYQNEEGLGDYTCNKVANVWRFDFSKNRWFKEKKFGNHTIFSSKVTTFSVRADGNGRDLAGMVFAEDQFVSVNRESKVSSKEWSYASFYEWMVKEKESKTFWNMWVDPRPVWRKSDLVKQSDEVPPTTNI